MTLPSTRRKSSSRTASTAGPFVTSACHLAVLGTRPWEQSPWTGLLRSDPCQNSEPPISVFCVAPSLPHPLTLPAGHSLGNSQTLAAATTTTQRGSAPTRRWPVLTETRQRPPVFATLCESSRFGPRPHQRTARATRSSLAALRIPIQLWDSEISNAGENERPGRALYESTAPKASAQQAVAVLCGTFQVLVDRERRIDGWRDLARYESRKWGTKKKRGRLGAEGIATTSQRNGSFWKGRRR